MSETQSLSERTAEEIRALLARRKLSGRQLANALGVSQTWMSTRLNGGVPIDLNDLERIAAYLQVDVFDLLPARRTIRVVPAVPGHETPAYRTPTNGQPKATILTYPKGPVRPPAPGPEVPASSRRPGRKPSSARLSFA